MLSLTPIRRVVTGNDAQSRSKVVWDGPAPNSHEASLGSGRGHTDIWVWNETPLPINGAGDDGNLKYIFSGPPGGGHFRVVQARARPADYDRSKDPGNIIPSLNLYWCGKTALVSSVCGINSWIPKLCTAVSKCRAAAMVTGDISVAP